MPRTDDGQLRRPQVCIAGAGPAGVVLAYLLARRGIRVLLLEAQDDFDRDFRGDTLWPSSIELMQQIGEAESLLALPHAKARSIGISFPLSGDRVDVPGPATLHSDFPYVTILDQSLFLDHLCKSAGRFESFELRMQASVQELIHDEDGRVVGLRYRDRETREVHEVYADLVVACDGRNSRLRREAGLELQSTSPPMDVLWFRLPKRENDRIEAGVGGRVGLGRLAILIGRHDHWQCGFVIPKGTYREVREAGIEEFREAIIGLIPELKDRVSLLTDWSDIAFLQVQAGRLETWFLPGLLFIGDAAHPMSPVGGVGINVAIGDAVAAANVLVPAMQGNSHHADSDLAKIQRSRAWSVRRTQFMQGVAQKQLVARVLGETIDPAKLARRARLMARIPGLRGIVSHNADGSGRVKLRV